MPCSRERPLPPDAEPGRPRGGHRGPGPPVLDLLGGRVDGEVSCPSTRGGQRYKSRVHRLHGRREVMVRCESRMVQGDEVLAYRVINGIGQKVFAQRDEAVAFAIEQAKAELSSYMEHSRARRYDVRMEVRDIAYMKWGVSNVTETVVSAVAEETYFPHPAARAERPIGGSGPV